MWFHPWHFVILTLLLGWPFRVPCVSTQQTVPALTEVRGRVVNSVTGEPVADALVQIYGLARKVQFTTANGSFAFTDLPPGSYSPIARKLGFFNDQELSIPMQPAA